MASLLPGYEYDIFISYRQKDNKGDRWVSEFVVALKTELEATFKEDISIFFDENPHDRLQETYNVDKSLEGKLKCLIFIPILSQTYCDSKSYAWQHEFLSFNKTAKEDQFGREIKLRNGNVASRILPIRIHDLDPEDVKLFEKETVSVMRAMDFVFRTSTGVNRPLMANEDHPNDNLNKTFYRDQINKAAHAVKEIILGIKIVAASSEEDKSISREPEAEIKRINERENLIKATFNQKTKKILFILGIILFCLIGAFFIYKATSRLKQTRDLTKLEKSIAVLPFENLSSDDDKAWFNEGIADVIINQLSKISGIRVLGRTSTLKYREEQKSISEIGKELGVNYIIEGTVQRQEDKMRISVQLIRVLNEGHIWSDIYDREWKDIFDVQSDIAQRIAEELETVLSPEEKILIEKRQTKNAEAYNLYLQGRFFWNKRTEDGLNKSVEYFEKAIADDPDYSLAYAGLADSYFIQAYWGWVPWIEGITRAKELALLALNIDKNLAEAHTVLGALYNYSEWKWEEARKELKLAVDLNPNFVTAHHYYSELLDILGQNNEARKQINLALELDPYLPVLHALSSAYYYNEGKLKESLDECRILQELDPEYGSGAIFWREFNIYVKQNEDVKAVEALQKALFRNNLVAEKAELVIKIYNQSGMDGLLNWLIELELEISKPSPMILASRYAVAGKKDEALNWLEEALKNPPPDFPRINNNPAFDEIRSEQRFQVIIREMGLLDYQNRR